MTDEKTAPVKPPRDTEKDSGVVNYNPRNGSVTVKTSLLYLIIAGALGSGSFFGLRSTAPDPEVVKATASDVGEIKTSLVELNAALKSLADNSGRDRIEWERRFDDQQKAIDAMQAAMPSQKEIDRLEDRVKALEAKVK